MAEASKKTSNDYTRCTAHGMAFDVPGSGPLGQGALRQLEVGHVALGARNLL